MLSKGQPPTQSGPNFSFGLEAGLEPNLIIGISVGLPRTQLQTLARQRSSRLMGGQHKKQDPQTLDAKLEINSRLAPKNLTLYLFY
jgi:hypothetical protein